MPSPGDEQTRESDQGGSLRQGCAKQGAVRGLGVRQRQWGRSSQGDDVMLP